MSFSNIRNLQILTMAPLQAGEILRSSNLLMSIVGSSRHADFVGHHTCWGGVF